jgi:hypothetical protein
MPTPFSSLVLHSIFPSQSVSPGVGQGSGGLTPPSRCLPCYSTEHGVGSIGRCNIFGDSSEPRR